jgi:ATP-dependent DNA ligase I
MITVRFERGVYLPDLDLWLDPSDEKETAFVSHAHSDHIGNHREVILSEITARLMAARLPGTRREHALAFGRCFHFRGADITLYPAGHIFGSAQLYLTYNGSSLLYTGDFKLRRGESAEAIEWTRADTLIMETTYGRPQYVFPPTREVINQLTKFCTEALEEGLTPILFGYSLGKAQEILAALSGSGFQVLLHPSVYHMTRLYEEMRQKLPDFRLYSEAEIHGSVLICPPGSHRTRLVQRVRNRRTAVLTGWALDPGATHRYQCDVAFPLSDHADYPDLLHYVELVQPARVLTLHGYAREFAEDLRQRGMEAWALGDDNQLELSLPAPQIAPSARRETEQELNRQNAGFARFAEICDEISHTAGKLRKVEILSDYLRSLSLDELRVACVFLTGHAFSRQDAMVLQVGWAVIRRALIQASGLTEVEFRRIASGYGDAGRIAFEVLLGRTTPNSVSLAQIRAHFTTLQATPGPVAKASILAEQLQHSSAAVGSYLVRILTGDLRIGLKEGLVEEAIAAASESNLDEVKEAHMLTGDIGESASLARENRLGSASITLFRPVKSMLAIAEPSAESLWERIERDLAGKSVFAEQKFDGIRVQLHVSEDKVAIYSRDLRNISDEFPEFISIRLSNRVVLDGEILAFDQGKKLTFFDLQRRLGRKRTLDFFQTDDVPVIYIAFDLLWLDGQSLHKEPLRVRRAFLDRLELPERIHRSPVRLVKSSQDIDEAFLAARRASTEGLVIKDPDSLYTPGRRGGSWIKLKKELATLDVVVVGVEQGHGKRSHVISDYTFAVRDENSGTLQTIGRAYSGLTDAEIEDLTEHFLRTTIRVHGRFREVIPQIVLEIAFDSIQPSARHSSGLALRFPRIKQIRRDKSVQEIDTLRYARKLAETTDHF